MKNEELRKQNATLKAKVDHMEDENSNLAKGMKELHQELIKFSQKGK